MSSRDDTRRHNEWLEADGLGGFASGTVSGIRTRRYHALLLSATTPPTGRVVLVNGFDAWAETTDKTPALSAQRYEPGVIHPDGDRRIERFEPDPWPRWIYRLENGTCIEQQIVVREGHSMVALSWKILEGPKNVSLSLRPFLSGRDYHALHHENPSFRFDTETGDGWLRWRPYEGLPAVVSWINGAYRQDPVWYRRFEYENERERGLDFLEDLASPGVLRWDLSRGEAVWILSAESPENSIPSKPAASELLAEIRKTETERRGRFASRLHRAADAYVVRRGTGRTVIAGYPWFTDWGRDTFIALRGVGLATGRLEETARILLEWADAVSEGMLPNRFPDRGGEPEFNSVDASLWFIVAVHDYWKALGKLGSRRAARGTDERRLLTACEAILEGYRAGTRYGIRADEDGLLSAGEHGVQLTWMDAKVGDWVVTPRIGKPVEVQALWLNALHFVSGFSARWGELYERGRNAFAMRFWNEAEGCLYDVVDVDHQKGKVDGSFRPNQIFAVGGLPVALLDGERARAVVDAVEARLWTPLGLRSLAPGDEHYRSHYQGGVADRDGAYHQGTVWPWLTGAFVEAWLRVRGNERSAREEARRRFWEPLLRHLDEAGVGHVSEIADAEPPFTPRGCPFQAWSVGEALRLDLDILRPRPKARAPRRTTKPRSFSRNEQAASGI